jgi:hypothetical protein
MATWQYELSEPQQSERDRELWLQHAAGFILFEDVRQYAIQQIDPTLSGEAQAAARQAIDNAVGGLMQVIDGVTGGLNNSSHQVYIDFVVRLAPANNDGVLAAVDLRQGDGMCMAYHGWLEGDFGSHVIARRRASS